MKHLNIKKTDILVRFLASETSATENEMVQKWLEESQENKNYFENIKSLWNTTDNQILNHKYNTEDALKNVVQAITTTKKSVIKSKGYFIKLAVAASILLLIGVGIGLYKINNNKELIVTSANKVTKITFPDNSIVWLNRNSKLTYSKNYLNKRSIKFVGEGYFEIKPDPSHPFEITTNNAKITVLGTKFNVHAYPNDSETKVEVTSGKVKLTDLKSANNAKNETILLKGEKGITGNHTISPSKMPIDDPNYISWKTHEFVFNNTNINDIIKLVSNIYNADIKIENTNTKDCNLTGKYSCHSLDDMLDMLRIVLNISVEKVGNSVIIKTPGC